MTFAECLLECAGNTELLKQFDRLHGSNLSNDAAPINTMIDKSTGLYDLHLADFANFVYDVVWRRLPDEAKL